MKRPGVRCPDCTGKGRAVSGAGVPVGCWRCAGGGARPTDAADRARAEARGQARLFEDAGRRIERTGQRDLFDAPGT